VVSMGNHIEPIELNKRDKDPANGLYDYVFKVGYHFRGLLMSRMHAIAAVKITTVSPNVS